MPEGTDTTTTSTTTATESLGWRAGLPDPMKTNEAFKPFKTVGDFAQHHLDTATKLSEAETKLKDFIPRLPDDATDEEKQEYFNALGRPEKAENYEFDGEDKNAPEWTSFWKQQFHALGLTKTQAKTLSAQWNGQLQKMVDAYNAGRQKEVAEAESKLRTELGGEFESRVELAKRLWTKYGEGEFDKAFANGNSAYRATTIRMLLKFAALTGEDRSPQGSAGGAAGKSRPLINYDKSPAPPRKG
jgi:hypothetical protein